MIITQKNVHKMRTFDSDNMMWLVMDIYGIHEKGLPRMQKYKNSIFSFFCQLSVWCGEDRGKNMRQKNFISCVHQQKG